ncbi:superoxide dismutase [Candidatus Gottesmanbacteria bacterium]|nr:superoxide dismutase [Candidatus Gottesmanbacteria bacterium]
MFTLDDLPYAYNALEPFIDERTMQIHHDKHHAAYVKNLNDALSGKEELMALDPVAIIRDLAKVPEDIRTKVRNNCGGHVNHTMFWEIMTPNGGGEPKGDLAAAITGSFGSFADFQAKFAASGIGRFGSGWVWLVPEGKSLVITDTPNQDSPYMEGKTPILGLDVWEHAYYLKYQNLRADYIAAWWHVVNWAEVEKRFAAATT